MCSVTVFSLLLHFLYQHYPKLAQIAFFCFNTCKMTQILKNNKIENQISSNYSSIKQNAMQINMKAMYHQALIRTIRGYLSSYNIETMTSIHT